MHECVLTAGVYFDLFDVLKNKDCQFSCTDANMSIDSGGTESRMIFFRDSHSMWRLYEVSATKFDIVFLVKHLAGAGVRHVLRNRADLGLLPFPPSLWLPCIYFLFWIADSVLGNFCRCAVDPGHLFFSLFCHGSYSSSDVHLPKILPVSPDATSLSFLFSSASSPFFPPFFSAWHSKRSLGFLSLHLSHYRPVFQSRLNWERLTCAHKELALRPRQMKLNLLRVTLGENKQQM